MSSHRRASLDARWSLCGTPAGTIVEPLQAADASLPWMAINAPDTVAGALRDQGRWSLDEPPRRFDAEDWWFRAEFTPPPQASEGRCSLAFGGLAGECDVWLNGMSLVGQRQYACRARLRCPNAPGGRQPAPHALCIARRTARCKAPATALAKSNGRPPATAMGSRQPPRADARLVAARARHWPMALDKLVRTRPHRAIRLTDGHRRRGRHRAPPSKFSAR